MATTGKRYAAARSGVPVSVKFAPDEAVKLVKELAFAKFDETVEVAKRLGLRTLVHERNRGYGANQKTCYTEALRLGADVIVMLHPDYQYTPKLLPAMISLLTDGPFDAVLGSRVLGGRALAGGMPRYKYIANRLRRHVTSLFLQLLLQVVIILGVFKILEKIRNLMTR